MPNPHNQNYLVLISIERMLPGSFAPGCRGKLLVLCLLPEPLAAPQLLAALHGGLVVRYDRPDAILKERREPQGHAVDLRVKREPVPLD